MQNFYFLIIILFVITDNTRATQFINNAVVLSGDIRSFGTYEINQDDTVGSFIKTNGEILGSDEMIEAYNRNEVVEGVTVYLYRDGTSIGLKIKSGESLFNTIHLRRGDTIVVKYDRDILEVDFIS